MKLMKKMMIMAVVMILIPVLLIGGGSYFLVSTNMESAAKSVAKEMTEMHKEMIENKMDFLGNTMEVVALDTQIAELLSDNTSINKNRVKNYLEVVQSGNKDLIEMFVLVDTKGNAIVSNTSTNIKVNISDREYFKESKTTSKTSFSDVIVNKETGKVIFAAATPVKKNGKVLGYLVGTVPFENVKEIVSGIKMGKEGYGYLINKEGFVISYPDASKENKLNILKTTSNELTIIGNKMIKGENGQGMYTFNGVKKYVSYSGVGKWSLATTANYNDYMSSAIKIKNTTIVIAVITFLISLLFSFVFTKFGLIKPIDELSKKMIAAGDGDLTVRSNVKSKDEIKRLSDTFNKMMEMQSGIIEKIRSSADTLLNTAEELSTSAEETSSATEEITVKIENISEDSINQTKEISNINNSFDVLFTNIDENTKVSINSAKNSEESLELAEKGKVLVKDTVNSIAEISTQTDNTVEVLSVLDEATKEVSGISVTISEIASNINLLALNASIEAARAGEHGKGFAVVAEEIKKLAEQTSNESLDIQSLISKILQQVSDAIESIDLTKSSVDNGVSSVKEVDGMFTKIINSIEDIFNQVKIIGESMKDEDELAFEMKGLVNKVSSMAEATSNNTQEISAGAQEQAAAMETMATSAEETSKMADELYTLVSNFEI
ncbi:methyl-accepting chemotaxis protein [Helicovermis profundi]|uniref:Methyl-accepting chemotaxis protein n=1 Tax=Helicovermis profundi TaxID=3065157 RepID=A0AAU9E4N6_9FIRM|nr:methyl-accepting chemotaxis protein [Clostridia bacterium S502]